MHMLDKTCTAYFFDFRADWYIFVICSNSVEQSRFWCRAVFSSRWISSRWPFSITTWWNIFLKPETVYRTIFLSNLISVKKCVKKCLQSSAEKSKKSEKNLLKSGLKKLMIHKRISQNKQWCVNIKSKNVYWQIKRTWKKLQMNQ